jgi:hypothetical protein
MSLRLWGFFAFNQLRPIPHTFGTVPLFLRGKLKERTGDDQGVVYGEAEKVTKENS